MELARALNHETLVLSDDGPDPARDRHLTTPTTGSTSATRRTTPTARVPSAPEEIVREPGANPALQHYQAPGRLGEHDLRRLHVRDVGRQRGRRPRDGRPRRRHPRREADDGRDHVDRPGHRQPGDRASSPRSSPRGRCRTRTSRAPTTRRRPWCVPTTTSTDLSYSFTADADRPRRRRSPRSRGRSRATATASGWAYYGSGSTFAVNLDEEGPTGSLTSVYDDDGAIGGQRAAELRDHRRDDEQQRRRQRRTVRDRGRERGRHVHEQRAGDPDPVVRRVQRRLEDAVLERRQHVDHEGDVHDHLALQPAVRRRVEDHLRAVLVLGEVRTVGAPTRSSSTPRRRTRRRACSSSRPRTRATTRT